MRKQGFAAENIAATYLQNRGYIILGQNISYKFGELDLVAQDQQTLVFVEVKHRRNTNFGEPFEAVTKSKQQKIILAAQAYLKRYKLSTPRCRFDIISLVGDLKNPHIEHMSDAFWADY